VAAFEADLDGRPGVVVLAGIGHRRSRPEGRALAAAIQAQLGLDIDCISFVSARSVPKTSSGKLMRHACRQMWQAGEFSVLGDYRRERHDGAELVADGVSLSQLESIRQRYGLRGDETHSLTEAGIDSLDLVALLHEIRELIASHSSIGVAERVDVQLIQGVSIADLYRLVEQVEHLPQETMSRLGSLVDSVRADQRAHELELMRKDATLPFAVARPAAPAAQPARTVLLTGGTGFLGPFLLRSLLEQTSAQVQVLTRGASPAEALERLRHAMLTTGPSDELLSRFDARVGAVCGDLEAPSLGLDAGAWRRLADSVDAIYNNGAAVNYLFSYEAMRGANVGGTNELLRLAFEGRTKQFNQVSTTFIFGWATKDTLYETDRNAGMELLDFGYSQSKWVAEQRVLAAASKGLGTRIFRPALITPSTEGGGENFDITIRLLCFMIKHGIGVQALNQVSFLPADVTANNIVAIAEQPGTLGGSFHVTRDDYANMRDVTDIITQLSGRRFEHFALPDFVPEVVRRCTRDDLLYPLLDFLVGSINNISSMEFKRYDSSEYQRARNASPHGRADPSLTETVQGMLRFMSRKGIL
jgi:thioester reductase-like protein